MPSGGINPGSNPGGAIFAVSEEISQKSFYSSHDFFRHGDRQCYSFPDDCRSINMARDADGKIEAQAVCHYHNCPYSFRLPRL